MTAIAQRVEVLHHNTAAGAWEVSIAEGGPVPFETLAEAERIAFRWAMQNRPSELIVHDAYNRVVLRKQYASGQP